MNMGALKELAIAEFFAYLEISSLSSADQSIT